MNPKNTKASVQKESPSSNDTSGSKFNSIFEVVAGSYEKILYGLKLTHNKKFRAIASDEKVDKDSTLTLSESSLPFLLSAEFIFPAHLGCIRTIHVGPSRYLASGSSDEIIKLYDLKTRKELGSLSDHVGSISCVKFVGKAHMLSASEDGTILIWRTKDWEILKNLKGHKGRVSSVSPHPSGKLALSVGDDRLLLAWNLMTGQRASSTRLEKSALTVDWSVLGDMYALLFDQSIHVYATASPEPFCKITTSSIRSKFMNLNWIASEGKQFLAAGCSDGSIRLYGPIEIPKNESPNVTQDSLGQLEILAHSVRIKAQDIINMSDCELPRLQNLINNQASGLPSQFLISASSDGLILVWNLSELLKKISTPKEKPCSISLKEFTKCLHDKESTLPQERSADEALILASYHSKVRLTCLTSNFPFF